MKILFPEKIEEFERNHPDAREALERWSSILINAKWKHHAELKQDFPSADYVGNNRYVFNIRGNNYRTVVMVVFFAGGAGHPYFSTDTPADGGYLLSRVICAYLSTRRSYTAFLTADAS